MMREEEGVREGVFKRFGRDGGYVFHLGGGHGGAQSEGSDWKCNIDGNKQRTNKPSFRASLPQNLVTELTHESRDLILNLRYLR
jgi:hypothetical protein